MRSTSNLAYRWFCGLGLEVEVPDHSTASPRNWRHGRFPRRAISCASSSRLRSRALHEGKDHVGRRGFRSRAPASSWQDVHIDGEASPRSKILIRTSSRAVAEYLSVLDDAAFGGATPIEPKVISPTDPAARCYTASANSVAGWRLFRDNYLIDLKHAGDHGRRGDDDHSPGRSVPARSQSNARPHD